MRKYINEALNSVIKTGIIAFVISCMISILFLAVIDDPIDLLLMMAIVWIFVIVLMIIKIVTYVRFKSSIYMQIDRFNLVDNETYDEQSNACKGIYILDDWIVAPSYGVAVSKPFFESVKDSYYRVKGSKRYQVVITDIDGKKHSIDVSGKNQMEIIEKINTWAYGENVTPEVIVQTRDDVKSGRSKVMFAVMTIVVCIIVCIVGIILVADNDGDVISSSSDAKEKRIVEELRSTSIDTEQFDKFSGYIGYRDYGPYDDEYAVYVDEEEEANTYGLTIDNTSNYIMCGYINLSTDEEGKDIKYEDDFRCIRPNDFYYASFTADSKPMYYDFKEFNHISLYYQSSWSEDRTYDYDEEYFWYNIVESDLDYSEAISVAKNIYGETIIVNEDYALIYIYDEDSAEKYRLDSGYTNYKVESALYAALIDTSSKTIEMYKMNQGESVYIESISMEELY